MRKCLNFCLVLGILFSWSLVAIAAKSTEEQAPGRTMAQQATKDKQLWITADHAKHEILQQTFTSGPEVTTACLSCHSEAAKQFHKTIHWTWLDPNVAPEERVGKAGLSINNFCIAMPGSYPRCTSCHAGYGWKDKSTALSVMNKPVPIKNFRPVPATRLPRPWFSRAIRRPTTHLSGIKSPKAWGARPVKIAAPAIFSAGAVTASSTGIWILR
jgi:hypothetical protein